MILYGAVQVAIATARAAARHVVNLLRVDMSISPCACPHAGRRCNVICNHACVTVWTCWKESGKGSVQLACAGNAPRISSHWTSTCQGFRIWWQSSLRNDAASSSLKDRSGLSLEGDLYSGAEIQSKGINDTTISERERPLQLTVLSRSPCSEKWGLSKHANSAVMPLEEHDGRVSTKGDM
jgi:hypothetical protein